MKKCSNGTLGVPKREMTTEETFINGSLIKPGQFGKDGPGREDFFDPKRASDLISEEVSTNGSLEQFSSEVFINGSLPENLSSSPLLPLYKSVVRTMFLPWFPSREGLKKWTFAEGGFVKKPLLSINQFPRKNG